MLIVGAALFAMGYEVAGAIVGLGGALIAVVWRKLLGMFGIRSSR